MPKVVSVQHSFVSVLRSQKGVPWTESFPHLRSIVGVRYGSLACSGIAILFTGLLLLNDVQFELVEVPYYCEFREPSNLRCTSRLKGTVRGKELDDN